MVANDESHGLDEPLGAQPSTAPPGFFGQALGAQDDDFTSILPRRERHPTQQQQATPPSTTPDVEQTAESESERNKQPRRRRAKKNTELPATHPRTARTSFYVPVAVAPQVNEERRRTGRTNGEIVRDAIDQTHERLSELVKPNERPTEGSLFAPRREPANRGSEPLTPLAVSLYESDLEVIDKLVATTGANSRSHLVSTALAEHYRSYEPA